MNEITKDPIQDIAFNIYRRNAGKWPITVSQAKDLAVNVSDENKDDVTRALLSYNRQYKAQSELVHGHYFRDVSHLEVIDPYRICELYGVTNPALAHVTKKALCAGGRGHKDLERDVQDMIDTLRRWQDMREEDKAAPASQQTLDLEGS